MGVKQLINLPVLPAFCRVRLRLLLSLMAVMLLDGKSNTNTHFSQAQTFTVLRTGIIDPWEFPIARKYKDLKPGTRARDSPTLECSPAIYVDVAVDFDNVVVLG